MPGFTEHINQGVKNLKFLEEVSLNASNCWDWLVTISFYAAVHFINGHIARLTDQHYRSHEHVKEAISPYNKLTPTKLPENVYLAYEKLRALSRRSRYLIHENSTSNPENGHFTYDKHLKRAIKYLDVVMNYLKVHHSVKFDDFNIKCIELKSAKLEFFTVNS